MIVMDCLQGSEQWEEVRRGIPTASRFHEILTPKTVQPSKSADRYLTELIAETLPGYVPRLPTFDMERGTELESEGIDLYETVKGVDAEKVGFVFGDESKSWGGSPDALVEGGGVEVKCPRAETHIGYMLNPKVPGTHLSQIYGYMLITGREWWDWFSYHPDLAPVLIRVERDESFEKWAEAFRPAISAFCERLKETRERLGL